jgi:hypothetical protein
MGRVAQLLCRHDYEAVEHVGDDRLDAYVLRCSKCGKTRRVSRGDDAPVGSHDIQMGRRPQLPRR